LAQLAIGEPAVEADLKALETGIGGTIEVSTKPIIAAANAFQSALDEIAKAAAVPVLQPTPDAAEESTAQDLNGPPRAVRHRLQDERASITHKFSIAGP
jgi:ribonucleoside-diphosphate reductase alpha chain